MARVYVSSSTLLQCSKLVHAVVVVAPASATRDLQVPELPLLQLRRPIDSSARTTSPFHDGAHTNGYTKAASCRSGI